MNELEIKSEALAIVDTPITVVDNASYSNAAGLVKSVKSRIKKVKEFFAPIKSKSHAAWKEIVAKENEVLVQLEGFSKDVSAKMVTYHREEERKAREEQMRIEAEQRKRDEEMRLREAEAAEKSGDKELAEEILNEEPDLPVVKAAPAVEKIAGVSYRDNWKAEVTDEWALIEFVANNPEWNHLIDVNTKALNQLARSQKGAMRIPGVKAINDRIMVTR